MRPAYLLYIPLCSGIYLYCAACSFRFIYMCVLNTKDLADPAAAYDIQGVAPGFAHADDISRVNRDGEILLYFVVNKIRPGLKSII